jgi:Flp pilus assembly protein TadG
MVPWLFFLFVGVLDFGFYFYAAINVQNAARAAALANATSAAAANDPTCTGTWFSTVLQPEMNALPNARQASNFTCSGDVSDDAPVSASASLVSVNGLSEVAQVSVTYRTLQLIPIPGVVDGRFTITRVAQVPVISATPTS